MNDLTQYTYIEHTNMASNPKEWDTRIHQRKTWHTVLQRFYDNLEMYMDFECYMSLNNNEATLSVSINLYIILDGQTKLYIGTITINKFNSHIIPMLGFHDFDLYL